jgi:hypothetical protein
MTQRKWYLPEVWFTAALIGLTFVLSSILGVRFNLPSGERAAFVGIHYLYPLVGVAIWGVFALFGQRRHLAKTFLIALPCYAVVLVCHFNLKLWIPHINPMLWDPLLWRIDSSLHPIVDACFAVRRAIAPLIPLDGNFYMWGFIIMFYMSFCALAVSDPHDFRTLFLAALFFQGFGGLTYLLMPALGPFIYERGIEPMQTMAEQGMLQSYHSNIASGTAWIAEKGSTHITVGLAAMPSLHVGGSFLFLLFAWRHARVLVPFYIMLFSFILIDSIATRWHYLIDVPAGMVFAFGCVVLAERLNPRVDAESRKVTTARSSTVFALVAALRRKLTEARA